jgi:hypothetical protein
MGKIEPLDRLSDAPDSLILLLDSSRYELDWIQLLLSCLY